MKRVFALLFCVALLLSCGTSNKTAFPLVDERDVPQKFIKSFQHLKPDVTQVKWEKMDSLTYRANYDANGNKARIQFDNAGQLSSWIIPLEYCANIKDYITQNYEGFKIDEVILADLNKKEKAYFATISRKKDIKQIQFDLTQQFSQEIPQDQIKK